MFLQDLFDSLASGEIVNLSLANSVTGSIKEEAYPKLVRATNRGLLSLYKRFLLKKKNINLVQQTDVTQYQIKPQFLGYPEATGPSAYLLDHPNELFMDDILKIISITNSEDEVTEINPSHPYLDQTYFKTSSFDTVDLVTTSVDQIFTIKYQARHPKIVITDSFDPETLTLDYPPFIEDALIKYIASLLIQGKTTKASEGEGYASNTWRAQYEIACTEITQLGLAEDVLDTDDRFSRRGFV